VANIDPINRTVPQDLIDLAAPSVALARRWAQSAARAESGSAALLANVLKDEQGLAFTIGFVDRVVRPEDVRVAGRNLSVLAADAPGFLPWHMKTALRIGGALAPVLPWIVVPVSRRILRTMVGHLVVDARPNRLGHAISALRRNGSRLNLNLLGEAVLGEREAQRRIGGTRQMLERADVDYVSIKVSSVVSQLSMWAFDETVERVVERLTPLYEVAAASQAPKFINLDMEEYRDLDLTIAVFTRLLEQPQLKNLEAGIVLQAYLPDALGALVSLTHWAQARVADGGAPIKVRIVKGANLAMEMVDATVHGWSLATYGSKQATDTNYKRVLNWALNPAHTAAVKVGVAGHNLFDIAFAHLLAERRGVQDRVEMEMLLGMAEGQAARVREDIGGLLLYTPVVHPGEFDSAISYLVRRLEENASPENFMSAVFELADDDAMFNRERDRFLRSLEGLTDDGVPGPNRTQSRRSERMRTSAFGFENEPDTDPALDDNRVWGRAIMDAAKNSALGVEIVEDAVVPTRERLEAIIGMAREAATGWGARGGRGRAVILRRAADQLALQRGRLLEVMASETGKTLAEGDPEVSEAIDFASYYATSAVALDDVDGALFSPVALTVVTPPWNFPLAIPAGSVLAALAAGSSVIVKPARQAQRTGALMVQALWDAGVPRDVLQLVTLRERDLGRALVSDPGVDRVILTGGYETAELFRSWRPDLPLLGETSGKNAIIVTPSADLDLAVTDIVKSAFGHAGQKCSAASLVILVGSVARSERFERQLVDAATTLSVGYPVDPTTQMGPLIEPAHGKLLSALTRLDDGERWLLKPRRLDDNGQLWSPGIRAGVRPASYFHTTEFFGPVLGIMRASTLAEAIELQNGTEFGLTAGIHTLDSDELDTWLDGVEAGNLYVNRGTTGAIVQRQPFGGWKRSSVGTGGKAGGPNYLTHLGSWISRPSTAEADALLPALHRLLDAAEGLAGAPLAPLRRSLNSDQAAWEAEFGTTSDVSALGLERNIFRYRPARVAIRIDEAVPIAEFARVVAAGVRSGADITISSPPLVGGLAPVIREIVRETLEETNAGWLRRIATHGPGADRIRYVGDNTRALSEALNGDPGVAIYAGLPTESGRVELLPFLREQAISITAHRFGNPDHWSDDVI
jgi:RHH-type proline utilization regulon transcriptional repressor/proline dehydrogenase/delta 1-pyrroline-5-carboxylate dehydrogenase